MAQELIWTNESVLNFSRGGNPMAAIEAAARQTVTEAMDKGWAGPPFDPLRLAEHLGLAVEPRSDIPDARTVPLPDGRLKIEFNPLRPRGRVRFSIAHEVAHSLFPDCADRVRHRGQHRAAAGDDWQLEMLCNIGAAELLMPLGSFADLQDSELSIDKVLELRKRFDVSIEALLIRMIKLSSLSCAAFCASRRPNGERYRVDYFIPSGRWAGPDQQGHAVPQDSVVYEVNAIGYTAIGREKWLSDSPAKVECVGLAPYPGSLVPRVVGLVVPIGDVPKRDLSFKEIIGDALAPRGKGRKIVAHVVPDSGTAWRGGGFAAAMRERFPHAWHQFKDQVHRSETGLTLGQCYRGELTEDVLALHMVAQRGVGPSPTPRIRYAALNSCLAQLKELALEENASVHMPRVGTGHAGGDWRVIRELIMSIVAEESTPTSVYTLPPRRDKRPIEVPLVRVDE